MSFFTTEKPSPIDEKQSRLMQMAAVFLLLYALTQTLSPAARLHAWDVEYRWNHWIGFVVWLIGTALVHHQLIRRLPDRDPFIFPVIALLSGWGLLAIWRLDWVMGARQTVWLGVCLLVFAIGLRVPDLLGFLRRYKYLWLTGGLLITALTFIFGTYPGGTGPRLWLGCCGVYLQPSEPLKLLLIAYLAAYLADRLPVSFSIVQLLTPTLILIGTALALLLRQRDLGTASLFILIYTIIVYLASRRWRLLVGSALILLLSGVTGYMMFDVVRIRVDAWLNPWLDPAGRSYQIVQSLLAIASGGIIGRGPGLGSPGVVPVAHSDFIFASIAEETGLLGAFGLLILLALLVGRGFRAAMQAPNNYQRFLSAGLSAYLTMQAILIIGGNLRLLPLTGVTLPFVSYGGSSLLTAYVSALLLVVVSSPGEENPAPLPSLQPYLLISGGLLAGLLALGLATGWWAAVRSDQLLTRTDNPRRGINDRYVMRGALLDRSDVPISRTTGVPGAYQREYDYLPLSTTSGYNSPLYGQSGLENGLDPYLRGLRGNPSSLIWSHHLLYGQPPPGLDVRLTIDLEFQRLADRLLADHTGALVLVRADTGEILAIASHPHFNPNQLENQWADLIQDPTAPLINRATQGQYPPGAALGPFLMGLVQAEGSSLPPTPADLSYTTPTGTLNCAIRPERPFTFGETVANGCPGSLAALRTAITDSALENLFQSLGFYSVPALPLQTAASPRRPIEQLDLAIVGQENLTVSPLQMALAAAALSSDGQRPEPSLTSAVLTPHQGWVLLPRAEASQTVLGGETESIVRDLTTENNHFWQTVALAGSPENGITWYLAGTRPEWPGAPLALALVLEENDPAAAERIGQTILNEAQN